jgi:YidC/Oxa1 family membrane protein insertase
MPFVLANVLQPLVDFFEGILKFFHDSAGLGWGTSIIALTVVVRAALVPLTVKQFRSMQALVRLQPEIKKLQQKYGDDKQRLNQEMMKFYQENKVNPFASCLPLLAQLPVFFALFYLLRDDLRLEICPNAPGQNADDPIACGASPASEFLFIPDITDKATGGVLVVLLVLYVGSQLLSTLLMPSTADKTQRTIFIALPFIFIPFIQSFPAGLLLYWITTNLWTGVQQALIRKTVGPITPPGQEPGPGLMDMLKGKQPEAEAAGAPASRARAKEKVAAGKPARTTPPPRPPRKKKKRSGRRR